MGRRRYDWQGRFRTAGGHLRTVARGRFGATEICPTSQICVHVEFRFPEESQ